MPWRQHGHARVNARFPEAAGICDRCGACYSFVDLRWQFDYAGERLFNKRILVCRRCEDEYQEQLRARILTPDPLPVLNARPEPFAPTGVNRDETDYFYTEFGTTDDLGMDQISIEGESQSLLIRENESLGEII